MSIRSKRNAALISNVFSRSIPAERTYLQSHPLVIALLAISRRFTPVDPNSPHGYSARRARVEIFANLFLAMCAITTYGLRQWTPLGPMSRRVEVIHG